MRTITDSQVELIDKISKERQGRRLNAGVLEDDIHVTEALHALSTLQYPHVQLVFGGEPGLAKAYRLIERITFGVDLRVVLADDHGLSQKELYEHLRTFYNLVRAVMTDLNFVADKKGSYGSPSSITMSWLYQSRYPSAKKPRLHLDFSERAPRLPTLLKPIGYLDHRLDAQEGPGPRLHCLAVGETLAENVSAFLRWRAVNPDDMKLTWEVRHIYDAYCVALADPSMVAMARTQFPGVVAHDVKIFEQYLTRVTTVQTKYPGLAKYDTEGVKRREAFVANPKACLLRALSATETEAKTLQEYYTRLLRLIYGNVKPTFEEAFAAFKTCALALLETL